MFLAQANRKANRESRKLLLSRIEFVTKGLIAGITLLVDYFAGLQTFEYLAPTLGGVSLGPPALALTIPIAVLGVHILISDQRGYENNAIRRHLRRGATIGVFVYLIGMAAMVALSLLDSTESLGTGSGAPGVGGAVGNITLDTGQPASALMQLFLSLFSTAAPIVFSLGMVFIFMVSVFVVDRLITGMETNYAFFSKASGRSKKVKAVAAESFETIREIDNLDAREKALKARLPHDVDDAFTRLASSHIAVALHEMKQALPGLDDQDALIGQVLKRNGTVPPHITSKRQGLNKLRELHHETSPFAILKQLGCVPPKEEN